MTVNYKRKLNKKKIIIFIMSILLFFIVIGFIYFLFNKDEVIGVLDSEVHTIEETDTYTLKIDYPIFHIKEVDNKVKEYVDKRKKEFIDVVDKIDYELTAKYDFLLNVTSSEYNDIINIHMNTLSYTGGAHYMRDDESIHYNKKTKQFMNLSDFFIDTEAFNKIDDLAYHYIMKLNLKSEKYNFSEIWVRRGIIPNALNYSHFTFKKEGLEILFPPYQIASWADGEIKITIPYSDLNELLKDEYKGSEKEDEKVVLVPEIRDLSKYEDKKLLAFTFDDGPNTSTTSLLLDNLDKYDAKVTFFVLGSRIDAHSEVLQRAYLEGNQIGSHTYNHQNLFVIDNTTILKEINDTNEKIKEVTGEYPKLIRPPYGNTNSKIKALSSLSTVLWDVDTLDWKSRNAEKVCEEIMKSAHDGAIILLHDIYESSVNGALMAMDKLSKEGYAFVTISEMATLKNRELNNEETYYNFK